MKITHGKNKEQGMKILLILASDIYYKSTTRIVINRIINLEPVMLSTLAALVPKELNARVRIVDEGIEKGDYRGKLYDVVGISCCTASAPRAYALCRYWKKKGAHVVLGGVHPTLNPEEASQYADTVITGAAEKTWPQFLLDFKNGTQKALYEQDGSEPLSSPVPDRSVAGSGYTPIPSVIANRGCTFTCEYCTIQSVWRKRPHTRPIGEVVEEIKSLRSKYVILLDPGPSSDREYMRELYEAIRPLKVWWGCQSTVDTGFDPDLLEAMRQSGCIASFLGFESFSQEGLDSIGKKRNTVDRYKEAVTNFHEKGITIVGAFMIGFDTDTHESIRELPRLIAEIGVDFPRCAVLTPYPGTPFFNRMEKEKRLLHKQWHLYDSLHVVFKPANMTPQELLRHFHTVWGSFFKWGKMVKRVISNKTMPKYLYSAVNMGFRRFVGKVVRLSDKPYDPEYNLHRY
ncbi:MAG: B12-binding domain-containing radical SAM protein [Spirochaetales bacterium]|nr:B12-binding domain-containing radical SAM protein [Spirochaetales bacterium]